MATPDPLAKTSASAGTPVSKTTFVIAGLFVDVYGVEQLPAAATTVSCLWLLHPRLSSKERMALVAETAIRAWNAERQSEAHPHGLIAVAFDQRNHGTRLADKTANEAWRGGNPRHAQDMFSIYQGTAADTSMLLDYLPAYVFPDSQRAVTHHLALGVSLGGHATWHCVLHDARIAAGVVVIGCADYVRLMTDRAAKSKLATWTTTSPPGSTFLGSRDFAPALIQAVNAYDPAGLLLAEMFDGSATETTRTPTERELRRLVPLMDKHLAGKRILNLAGGADKLVPSAMSKPFIDWLQSAIKPGGWYAGHGVHYEEKIFDGVGHEMTSGMLEEATRFIVQNTHDARSKATAKI